MYFIFIVSVIYLGSEEGSIDLCCVNYVDITDFTFSKNNSG